MLSNRIIYTVLSAVSLLFSLYVQFMFADFFSGQQLDLFYLAVSVCGVVISMSAGGLGGYLISQFSRDENPLLLNVALNSFSLVFSIIGILVFILLTYTSKYVMNIEFHTTIYVAGFFFLYLLSLSLNLIFQSYSYGNKGRTGYLYYEICSVVSYIIIAVLLLFYKESYLLCCALFCCRGLIQILFYSVAVRKELFAETCSFSKMRDFMAEVKLLMSGSAYYKSEPILDRYFLITSSHGLAAYHLINQIYTAILGLWFKVSVSPLVQKLSSHRNDSIQFKRFYKRGMLEQIIIAIIAGIILFFTPFIQLFSAFEIFRPVIENTNVIYLLFGFFFASLLGQVVSNAYYSQGNARIPVVVSCITYTIFLPVKYYVVKGYGINGLCVLVSIYHSVNLIILWLLFRVNYLNGKKD